MKANKLKKLVSTAFAFCAAALYAELPDPIVWFDIGKATDASVPDASGNGHDLTLGPTVQIVDDVCVGKALKVSGLVNDYATFSCSVVSNTTISFWMNRDATDGSIRDKQGNELNTIPYLMSPGYSGFGINYTRNQDALNIIDQQNDPQTVFSGPSPQRCEWHHVVVTIEYAENGSYGELTCRSYLDGQLKGTTVKANNREMRSTGKQTVILFNNGLNGTGVRPTSGRFGDIRFYDVCLTDEQIRNLTMDSAGKRLVMRYAFDEISAEVDENGRHYSPEATGFGSAMTLGKNVTLVDEGIDGKALHLMGTAEIGGLVKTPVIPLKERTYSVWLRSSSRRKEMNSIVANSGPRLFHGHNVSDGGYGMFSDCSTLGRNFVYVPSGCGVSAKTTLNYGVAELDTWSHLAIVERLNEDGKGVADVYVNGELAKCSSKEAYELQTLMGSKSIYIGNTSFAGNRYFCGDLDELRIYNYALGANEVRRLYRGLAAINAGEDFTVAGMKGCLQGSVLGNVGDGTRKGYAGVTKWTLVSGGGAKILQPDALETEVMFENAGVYVFRLSITDLGVTKSDDVEVTCVESPAENTAPTVDVTASGLSITQPDFVELTASTSDDGKPAPSKIRVRWLKKSGPGGVWFELIGSSTVKARFGVPGTYVVACIADDGELVSKKEVTITVADREDGLALSSGLSRCWSLDGQAEPYFPEAITYSQDLTVPDYQTLTYVRGRVVNGARSFGALSCWNTGLSFAETKDSEMTKNHWPQEQYQTVSCWVYIDPSDTNEVQGANVVFQEYTGGIRYQERIDSSSEDINTGFSIIQQGSTTKDGGSIAFYQIHYAAPNPSPVGRWLHLCAVIDRRSGTDMQMWYDGVLQPVHKKGATPVPGRVMGKLLIGGHSAGLTSNSDYNGLWNKDGGGKYSRTFPGVIDEVRIWNRKLTPGEIRYLAANPILGENGGPAVDVPVADPANPMAKTPTQLYTAVFADKLPEGGTLSYEWIVLSGDESLVTIGDRYAPSTTFVAKKKGDYVLQLRVFDGERTAFSKPLFISVAGAGLVISIR